MCNDMEFQTAGTCLPIDVQLMSIDLSVLVAQLVERPPG